MVCEGIVDQDQSPWKRKSLSFLGLDYDVVTNLLLPTDHPSALED
jgi:hypothetical protein